MMMMKRRRSRAMIRSRMIRMSRRNGEEVRKLKALQLDEMNTQPRFSKFSIWEIHKHILT